MPFLLGWVNRLLHNARSAEVKEADVAEPAAEVEVADDVESVAEVEVADDVESVAEVKEADVVVVVDNSTNGDDTSTRCGDTSVSVADNSVSVSVSVSVHRTDEEVEALVKKWEERNVTARAIELFPTYAMLHSILRQVAQGVHKNDDPIFSQDSCVIWHGDVIATQSGFHAAFHPLPEKSDDAVIFWVNCVLVVIFGSDECFKKYLKLPLTNRPLRMDCGNQKCVNAWHICVALL